MAKIAIDFDGCIHGNDEAKDAITKLVKDGHHITIVTPQPADIVEDYLKARDIKFDRITFKFDNYDLLIGPKVARFHAWNLTLPSLIWNLPESAGGKKVK